MLRWKRGPLQDKEIAEAYALASNTAQKWKGGLRMLKILLEWEKNNQETNNIRNMRNAK